MLLLFIKERTGTKMLINTNENVDEMFIINVNDA